tara:strand:- start:33973 stop:35802 length:1830 start_codon:yes stop_codon:yes gene_type:complete
MANIVLKTLEFSNMFSYGNNNKISLNSNKISQLTAPNGSGKSSIAIILQEILFNKNIKGIKKADIINRYSKSNSWLAKLDFLINEKDYTIKIERTGAKSSVQFSSSKEDLTEHKVLDTYKKIQETLNLDFDVFSQLTYQSSIDLLEFLKATDTNRKKFLINLFNLEKYVKIGEALKIKSNSLDKELATLQGELNSIDSFLSSTEIPEKIVLTDIPETNQDVIKSLALLEKEVEEYEQTCKKIDKNNMYIQERELLEFDMSMKAPHTDPNMFSDLEELNQDVTKAKLHKQNIEKSLIDIDMSDTCYACGQTIDNSQSKQLHKDLNNDLCNTVIKIEGLLEELEYAKERVNSYQYDVEKYNKNQKTIEKFEQLARMIDESSPTTHPNYDQLQKDLVITKKQVDENTFKINKATEHNQKVGIHNAKVDALIEQKETFSSRQHTVKNDIINLSSKVNNLNVLKKAFSTSGIVAFKLENLTKELEVTINHYLASLSDGQFQVSFKLDKEKLNIIVSNDGIDTPIETVSGGEFSRIQTAILLAIRSLLAKLGGSSINLLFLDEITGVLDEEGKEKLIEVLREEKDLNVFLISHDFTHPLIETISIIKENNISSIH